MAPAGPGPGAPTTEPCVLDPDTVARYERVVAGVADGDASGRPDGGPANPFVLSRLLGPVFRTLMADSGFRVPGAILHAEQVIEVDRPLEVGTTVRAEVSPPDAFPYGLGTTAVAVRACVVDDDGEQVATLGPVIAAQGDCGIPVSGEPRPPAGERAARRDLVATWSRAFDEHDLARYADAADDHNPIHVDRRAAAALGFPALVVHGMCTLAAGASEAARRVAGGPGDLVRVSTRFSRPLLEGQEVVYELYATDDDTTFALQARHGNHAVLKGCTIQVRAAHGGAKFKLKHA